MEPQGNLGLIPPLAGVARRIGEAAVTLAGLVALTFVLLKWLPGSPFDDETPLHPAVREALGRSWNLRGSVTSQFFSYVSAVLQGDLGVSYVDHRPVAEIVRENLSSSLSLNFCALVVVFILGFSLALAAAGRPEGRLARALDALTIAMISLPSLFLGPVLIWLFAIRLDWLPVAFLERPLSYVLPVVTLAMRPAAHLARLLSASLRDAGRADYMRTAKAKGLSETRAMVRHALRNSLLPVLGYAGPLIVGLVSGSFIVEVLFAIKGLGVAFADAISNRDLPVILGLTLFDGGLLVLISMGLDGLMRIADPRLTEGA